MVILLPSPELQFCDAIGAPYAAGTIETYIAGTSTPKATWNDPAGGDGHLNTNPIVLDSAGRCILYGDGVYRLVLRDALGNEIWDQVTSSVVSSAMAPVVAAPTLADAVDALGIQDLIDASVLIETTRAEAAESTLTTALAAEVTRAEAAEATNAAAIASEATTRAAADTTLQGEIDTINATLGTLTGGTVAGLRAGSFDLSIPFDISFAPAFPTACCVVTVEPLAVGDPEIFLQYLTLDNARVTGNVVDNMGTLVAGGNCRWFAIGYALPLIFWAASQYAAWASSFVA